MLEDIFVYEYSMACVVMYVRMCLLCNRKKKKQRATMSSIEKSLGIIHLLRPDIFIGSRNILLSLKRVINSSRFESLGLK